MSDGRYLTDIQKHIGLSEFQQGHDISPPDPEIELYLWKLNRICGLCTLQSCSGHRKTDARDGSEYFTCGNLWLWLSEAMMEEFYKGAFELARNPCIERLRILFQAHGQEIVDIEFKGKESGALVESMRAIIDFFKKCVARAAPEQRCTAALSVCRANKLEAVKHEQV